MCGHVQKLTENEKLDTQILFCTLINMYFFSSIRRDLCEAVIYFWNFFMLITNVPYTLFKKYIYVFYVPQRYKSYLNTKHNNKTHLSKLKDN